MLIGVLSDAHGHLAAFERGLSVLRAEGATELRFLGDAVGYVPEVGVLRALMRTDITCTLGNHEAMLLAGGIAAESEAVYRLAEARSQLDEPALAWVKALPQAVRQTIDDCRCLFLHGSPTDAVFAYVYPDTPLAPMVDGSFDVVFMGNTHRPFVREAGGALFVNVGSCGLPRDADARGAACLFDTRTREARIVRFSIASSAAALLDRHALAPAVAALLARCRDAHDGDGQ